MKKKTLMIPAFAAVFAMMFAFATPYALAEPSNDMHGKWTGQEHQKTHKAVKVDGFVGSLQITEDTNMHDLKDQVSVSLSEASDGLDVIGGNIGVAVNENGEHFLAWILMSIEKDSESETAIATIYVVDAVDVNNTTSTTKEFDHSMKGGMHAHGDVHDDEHVAQVENLEQRLSEPTGDTELDEIRTQFLTALQELREAHQNGDTDRAHELHDQLQELRNQLGDIRKF